MNQGETGFGLKCLKQHSALCLCCSSKCNTNAIMCGDQDCECHKGHAYCQSITIQKLRMRFDRKGQSFLPLLNAVYESLWRQSKQVNIEMEGMRKIIDSQQMKLSESEKRLYSLLVEKKAEGIIPSVVSEAMGSLEKEPEHNIGQRIVEVQKELEKKESEFKRMLTDIRKLVEIKEISGSLSASNAPLVPAKVEVPRESSIFTNQFPLAEFKFSPTLKHQYITANEKTAKANLCVGNYSATVCLQPDLLQLNFKRCKVQLKINKTTFGHLLFGVLQLSPNVKITEKDIHQKIEYGSLALKNKIQLGNKGGHIEESNNIIEYRQNDIIEIEYEKKTQRVTVRNVTKNTQSITYIKALSTCPLHFAVGFFNVFNQIQIIKSESQ